MSNASEITIEQVEDLAASLEFAADQRRSKLRRLIRAEARILAVRDPEQFPRRPVEFSDDDGHWDNSFAPYQRFKDHSGPRLIAVAKAEWDSVATSSGFYYDWRATTTNPGLYVDRHGDIFGAEFSGTGRFGQFAARPGNCDVMLSIDYSEQSDEGLTVEDLERIESALRSLAFPGAVARAAAEVEK